jgi:hypothetical protein
VNPFSFFFSQIHILSGQIYDSVNEWKVFFIADVTQQLIVGVI